MTIFICGPGMFLSGCCKYFLFNGSTKFVVVVVAVCHLLRCFALAENMLS